MEQLKVFSESCLKYKKKNCLFLYQYQSSVKNSLLIQVFSVKFNLFSFLWVSGEVPLAESECQAERGGRHGSPVQDHGRRHRGEPQEEIHG